MRSIGSRQHSPAVMLNLLGDLQMLIESHGLWVMTPIIFAETGLLVGFFLLGRSGTVATVELGGLAASGERAMRAHVTSFERSMDGQVWGAV